MPRPLRLLAIGLITAAAAPSVAHGQSLTRADSALIGRVLLAEDRRDAADGALAEAAAHADPRLQTLARRARGRIADPRFAARDSLPRLAPPPIWVEPSWRVRLRALAALRDDCNAMQLAAADSAWPVRFRAAALVRESCADRPEVMQSFLRWIREMPEDPSSRSRGRVSWHGAAHGLLVAARLRPEEASWHLARFAGDREPNLRRYAARAAAVLKDTVILRQLARDDDDNVAETAIEALAALTGHTDDAIYLAGIQRSGAQVVRAAATALKGSPDPAAPAAALAAFETFVRRANASERDARVALLEAAGRSASDDRPPPVRVSLPRDAVALALGRTVVVRVTMDRRAGGGSFDVRLRGDNAPMMAARILALVREGYYDGLTWHRVEHDFVIQGGSPGANEYVGLPHFLRDELGTVTHARGTLGMSTRGHDTGDAQWFVNLRDNARLDRDYTVWGEIVKGIDIVDGVLEGDRIRHIKVLR